MTALVAVLGLLSLAGPALQAQARARPLTIANVTIIDVRGGRAVPGMTVTIDGGRITSVAPGGAAPAAKGERIDGTGKFLIPGLWDMHVHLIFGDWFPRGRSISLPLFIANGVTGVRDMGSDLEPVLAWRAAIDAGTLLGPRIVTPGPMLDGPKPRFPSSVPIANAADGRRAVRDLKRRGADFIKLQSLIPREAVFAIDEEGKKQGIVVAGHVPDAVRASEASAAGQKSFEHLIGVFEGSSTVEDSLLKGGKSPGRLLATYDPRRATALFALLSRNHTWQCPTLVWEQGGSLMDTRDLGKDPLGKYAPAAWKDVTWRRFTDEIVRGYTDDLATRRRFVAKELEVVGAMHKAGVPMLAGTDTPAGVYVFPGFSLHEELQLLVRAGLTPLEALRSATLGPAVYLGREKDLGTVEAGTLADVVLLDANPLDDIRSTRRIAAVVARGRYLSRTALDQLLAGAESAARRQ